MQPLSDSIGTLIGWAQLRLAQAGIETPRREALLLLAHALGQQPGVLRLRDPAETVGPEARAAFAGLVGRRQNRAPLAYLTGSQGFWSLDLAVSAATLIPRADSETLVETLLRLRPDRNAALRMLDLGTGTGCLLLACLSEYRHGWGLGIDLSQPACALAALNSERNGLAKRCAFLCGSWTEALGSAGFDLVLSNPPYIASSEIGGLMPEVAAFEPREALDGGVDGLAAYRTILPRLGAVLLKQGVAILELGAGQLPAVRAMAEGSGLVFVCAHSDLSGTIRTIALRPA